MTTKLATTTTTTTTTTTSVQLPHKAIVTRVPQNHIKCDCQTIEQRQFLEIIEKSFIEYTLSGPRSNKKVNLLQNGIADLIRDVFKKMPDGTSYQVKNEYCVDSVNDSGKKRCDIVVLHENHVIIIFPVKFIMTNYSQNKNNYFENLTGEITHLKWANPDVHICPINLISSTVPYKDKNGFITKFEQIGNKFNIYEELVKHHLCSKVLNYKIDVEYSCHLKEKYCVPMIIGMSPYTSFESLLRDVLL